MEEPKGKIIDNNLKVSQSSFRKFLKVLEENGLLDNLNQHGQIIYVDD